MEVLALSLMRRVHSVDHFHTAARSVIDATVRVAITRCETQWTDRGRYSGRQQTSMKRITGEAGYDPLPEPLLSYLVWCDRRREVHPAGGRYTSLLVSPSRLTTPTVLDKGEVTLQGAVVASPMAILPKSGAWD